MYYWCKPAGVAFSREFGCANSTNGRLWVIGNGVWNASYL